MSHGGVDIDQHYPGIFRFKAGDKGWVRDVGKHGTGYKIEEATVREQHYHPDRHPWHPHGEGYSLYGNLWWDCYPGCRVFATKEEAKETKMGVPTWEFEKRAEAQGAKLEQHTQS